MFNPIKWLLTKAEPETKETTVTDTNATDSAVQTTASDPTPLEEVKAGVKDFEAAFSFVEQGVAQLGEAAKDELKALAQKYL